MKHDINKALCASQQPLFSENISFSLGEQIRREKHLFLLLVIFIYPRKIGDYWK